MESSESSSFSSKLLKGIKDNKYFIIAFVCLVVAVTLLIIYKTQVDKEIRSVTSGDSQVNPSLTQSSMIGSVGPTGPDGNMGPQGPFGLMGPQGPMGVSGYPGPDGNMGPQGPLGLMGPQGSMGVTGYPGPDGNMGFQGPLGLMGPQGPMGVSGYPGPDGNMGPQGPFGLMGPQGPTGNEGPLGNQGPMGFQGPLGNQGPMGIQGPVGNQGPMGIQGLVGNPGPQGLQGPFGNKGPVGDQGTVGFMGPQGPQGPQGQLGDQGPVGFMGPQGPQGIIGFQGPNGNAGANILMGNNTASLLNAPNGFYFTLPVIGVYTITSVGAPIVGDATYPQIAVNAGYTPYYSYNPVPIINRGIIFTNTSSRTGGFWQFQQPGIYEIDIYWTTISQAEGKNYVTFLGSVGKPGVTDIINNIAQNRWSSVINAGVPCSSVINTVVNVTPSMLSQYFFVSELAGIGIGTELSGIVEIKWVSQN